jgi:hypothetical protein
VSNYEIMRNLWVTITEVILVTVVAEILSHSAAAVVADACSKETGLLTSISGFLNTNGNRLFCRTIPLQSYSRIFSSPTQQSALFKHSGQRFNSLVVGSEHPHNGHSFLVVFSFLRSNISFFGNISR